MRIGVRLSKKTNRVLSHCSSRSRRKTPLFTTLTLLLGFYILCFYSFEENGFNPIDIVSFSVHGEDIENINSTYAKLYLGYGLKTFSLHFVYLLEKEESESPVEYDFQPPPSFDVIYDGSLESAVDNENPDAKNDHSYQIYQLVRKPTGHCRKLYRSGGNPTCRSSDQPRPIMDGHKYICLDPHLQVITESEETEDCLVLSFGVNYDISFDIAIRDANCEVMMFDIEEFDHPLAMEDDFVTFYQVGLSNLRVDEYIEGTDSVHHLDTLNNLAIRYNFANRLVNILKIDIEGTEWEVLRDLATQPYLDLIAQIAVEIHNLNKADINETSRDAWVTSKKEIFDALQRRGFERISFFDNALGPKTDSYFNVGELLLVNSKWYDEKFREEMNQKGFGFKILELSD